MTARNYQKIDPFVDHDTALLFGLEVLSHAKQHVGELFFNDGMHIHLCDEPSDKTNSYVPHISYPELCHVRVVDDDKLSIYKYQLIFWCLATRLPTSLFLYKVYPKYGHDEQVELRRQAKEYFNRECSVLYTVGSRFGQHLAYHTDPFDWRCHQNLQWDQEQALEFIDGEKVMLEVGEAYKIVNSKMPHRVLAKASNQERIFFTMAP